MHITLPQYPQYETLRVERLWNGEVCPDDRLWADVELSVLPKGVRVRVRAPMIHDQRIPDAPIGSRVEGLWEFDVVEVFFVGPGHQYVELELGSGGHWLLLEFDRIRHRKNAFETFEPHLRFGKESDKTWWSELVIPWSVLPENIRALNAYMITAGQFLAYGAVPGAEPDFHQPDVFPRVSV